MLIPNNNLFDELNSFPGMIEPIEVQLLFNTVKDWSFYSDDVFIEIGSFFGKSTKCISLALQQNLINESKPCLEVFDCFDCNSKGLFANSVYSFAKKFELTEFLSISNNRLSFANVTKHLLADQIANHKINLNIIRLKDINLC
jgi:hypothetical protein